MAKQEQTKIAPSGEWEQMIRDVKDLPEVYPKLKFGDSKTWEGYVDVVFLEDQPRFATFQDPFNDGQEARALFINVQVLSGPEAGMNRGLPMPAKTDHGLTRAVLGIAKGHQNRLKGVRVRIECRNYKHKKYGLTRGYTVSELPPQTPQ
jgi:hypothetical protein